MAKIPGQYVPLSTRYRRDRSIRRAGIMAELVFIRSLALVKREDTSGVIEDYDLDELMEGVPDPDAVVNALVGNQLWAELTTHSWRIRSWSKWNPSDESSMSGKLGNHIRWHKDKGIVKDDCPWCAGLPISVSHPKTSPDIGSGIAPRLAPDSPPDSGGDIAPDSQLRLREELIKDSSSSEEDGNPTPKKRTKNTYTPEFEQWWANYPYKKGSKFEASKLFPESLKLTDLETLIKSARAYGRTVKGGKDYVLHAERWLKRRKWEDAEVIQLIHPETNRAPELPEFIGELDLWEQEDNR